MEKTPEIPPKTFEQLVEEKATCVEFAWHGFIRIQEEGRLPCECQSCKVLKEIQTAKG